MPPDSLFNNKDCKIYIKDENGEYQPLDINVANIHLSSDDEEYDKLCLPATLSGTIRLKNNRGFYNFMKHLKLQSFNIFLKFNYNCNYIEYKKLPLKQRRQIRRNFNNAFKKGMI